MASATIVGAGAIALLPRLHSYFCTDPLAIMRCLFTPPQNQHCRKNGVIAPPCCSLRQSVHRWLVETQPLPA